MDLKELNQSGYENIDINHWYYRSKFSLINRTLNETIGLYDNAQVLEYGCGSGIFIEEIARTRNCKSWKFFGYDLFLSESSSRSHVQFSNKLDTKGVAPDFVIAADVLEHMDNPIQFFDDIRSFAERPRDVRILITVPAFMALWSAHDEFLGHRIRYNNKTLMKIIPHDFHFVRSYYAFGSLLPIAFLLRKLKGKGKPKSDLKPANSIVNWILKKLFQFENYFTRFNKLGGLTLCCELVLPRREQVSISPPTNDLGRVSIGIPFYNDADRIESLLREISETNIPNAGNISISILDDGSKAEEFEKLTKFISSYKFPIPVSAQRNVLNNGKGFTIRNYFLNNASGAEIIGFMDADGATNFSQVLKVIRAFSNDPGLDGVIGCRHLSLENPISRSKLRHVSGRVFATIVSSIFNLPIYDSQCGFKFFRASVLTAERLSICDNNRWLFDTQLLILSCKIGLRIQEMPIRWNDRPGSKVSLVSDSLKMFAGLMKFKKNLNTHTMLPAQTGQRNPNEVIIQVG